MAIYSEQYFKKQVMSEFKPCPILEECIAFMRYATRQEIRSAKDCGLFSRNDFKRARERINSERELSELELRGGR